MSIDWKKIYYNYKWWSNYQLNIKYALILFIYIIIFAKLVSIKCWNIINIKR